MELRQFRYFVAVAEERHFGRAAERLRIAQPGLSQQIKAIERSLGVQLFIRDKRHVELTEAGEALLDQARLVIELAARTEEVVRLRARGKDGLLKVGTGATLLHQVASEVLTEFQARFPDVEVQLHPGFGAQHLEAVAKRTLDVAVIQSPATRTADGTSYLRLGALEVLMAIPEDHRLAAFDRIPRVEILKEPFLTWARSLNPPAIDGFHRSLLGMTEHPRSVEVADALVSSRLLMVAEGKGIAPIPFPYPQAGELRIRGVVFRHVEDPPPFIEYGLVWFESNVSPFVSTFLKVAHEILVEQATERRRRPIAG